MGLPLVADVSTGVVITTVDLESVLFMRALICVAGKMVSVSLVSASEMMLSGIKVLSEVLVRSVVQKTPSELVLLPEVTAGTSVWPDPLVLGPAELLGAPAPK